ncbi:MAG: tetratricopeptide repeat protein [Bacteroidia bacterium]|nr:tetratricopeptide repeat protein [Bacteroidia bacterium]
MLKKELPFYALLLIIVSILILSYSNHFNNPFHFDDMHTIHGNKAIQSLKNIPQFFKDASTFSSLPANQIYRPGVTTLNAIDFWLGGQPIPIPFYYHLSIFISYLFLGVFLFLFFLKLFNQTFAHSWNKYIALLGVGFYLLHTANSETVNYIIARSDSFSTLMIIISFVIYLYKPNWRNKLIYIIPVIIGFFVKEPTIMVAPLLLTYYLFFEKNQSIPQLLSKNGFKEIFNSFIKFSPVFIVAVLLFILSSKMSSDTFTPSATSRFNYIITQPIVIVHYVNNFILPIDLSADTDWTALQSIGDIRVLIGGMFLIALIAIAVMTSKNKMFRPISFGIFWFLLALLPTSIIPLAEVLNDHRTFFPYIGLVIAITWVFALMAYKIAFQYAGKAKLKWSLFSIACIIISAHAYGTYQRNKIWSSGESLWHDVTIKSPKNGRGLMNYGVALMARGDYKSALNSFEKALTLLPNYSNLYINIAVCKSAMGLNTEVESYYQKAVLLNPNNPECYSFYANWLKSQARLNESMEFTKKGLEISNVHLGLNKLLAELNELSVVGDNPLAIAEKKAMNNPTADNYLNLSLAYYQNGLYEKCIEAANEALKIKSDFPEAYNNICTSYNMLKNWDKAIEAGEKGLMLRSDYELLKNNLTIAKKGKTENK